MTGSNSRKRTVTQGIEKKSTKLRITPQKKANTCKSSAKYPRPGPDEYGLYAIDGIIDARYDGLTKESCERWQYLVTWTGYPKSEAQWVTQYYAGAWYIEEYWQKQNEGFQREQEEAVKSEAFMANVLAANKWTRDSERSAFWTWLERKEADDRRAERREKLKKKRRRA